MKPRRVSVYVFQLTRFRKSDWIDKLVVLDAVLVGDVPGVVDDGSPDGVVVTVGDVEEVDTETSGVEEHPAPASTRIAMAIKSRFIAYLSYTNNIHDQKRVVKSLSVYCYKIAQPSEILAIC